MARRSSKAVPRKLTPVAVLPGKLGDHFALTPLSLVVIGSPPLDLWAEAGPALSRIGGATQWWIGDWINYGPPAYGEAYSQHIDLTGYRYQTLANFAYVAERVEFSRRREDSWTDAEGREHRITWSHHAAIAPLEPPEQDRLLQLAVDQKLAHKELRRLVKELKAGDFPPWLCYTDVWRIPDCDGRYGIEYPGRIPGQIVANTLYYFAREPGALVVDPMAGGGTTLDVCAALGYRCLAFDVEPARPDIVRADAREPWPVEEPADLIFIDPPYGSQQAEAYGGMATLEPPAFLDEFTRVLTAAVAALAPKGRLAILIAPMAIKTDYVDLPFEVVVRAGRLGLKLIRRVGVPGSTQQVGAGVSAACKADRIMLAILRDLLVFEKGADP